MRWFTQKIKLSKRKQCSNTLTAEMAEWLERLFHTRRLRVRVPCVSCQTKDFKIGIHSFPAWRSALKGYCGEFPPKVVDEWQLDSMTVKLCK